MNKIPVNGHFLFHAFAIVLMTINNSAFAISCYNGTFTKMPMTPDVVIPTDAEASKLPVVTGCKACGVVLSTAQLPMETASIGFQCDKAEDTPQDCFDLYQWSYLKSNNMTQMACKCCEDKCNKIQSCGLSPPIAGNQQQQQQSQNQTCTKPNGQDASPTPRTIFIVFSISLYKLLI